MNSNDQTQVEHFAFLKAKYQAVQVGYYTAGHRDQTIDPLLYLVLRRADLGIKISTIEWEWLKSRKLFETIARIKLEESLQAYRAEETQRLESEFAQLKTNYQVPEAYNLLTSSLVLPILKKLDVEQQLTDAEIQSLRDHQLDEIAFIARQIIEFAQLRQKYRATDYPDTSLNSPLYKILKQLDQGGETIIEAELEWLLDRNLLQIYEIYEQQKIFCQLKQKYHVTHCQEVSVVSNLYRILTSLDAREVLEKSEIDWLEQNGLLELVEIDRQNCKEKLFALLKTKYRAESHSETSLDSPLGIILSKLWKSERVLGQDIAWLKAQDLTETVTIAETEHFAQLCRSYRIIQPDFETFYPIMLRLEQGERLDRIQVAQLINDHLLLVDGEIAKAHHRLEAQFYETEYRRTGNQWNIPSAVSEWRKAKELEKALQLSKNLNLSRISDHKLKGAVLTTRGSTLRDLNHLDQAEACAQQALQYQPEAHQPYTLLGTICYGWGNYSEGDEWFAQAKVRGTTSGDEDYEMKRLVRNTKDAQERRKLVAFLFKKDPVRYQWARTEQKR